MPVIVLASLAQTNWVAPSDCRDIQIECIGGGGKASYGQNGNNSTLKSGDGGDGGGGGAYSRRNSFAVTPGASYPMHVGAGNGGITSFNASTCVAVGAIGRDGGIAANCVGDVRIRGESGQFGGLGFVGGVAGTGGDGAVAGGSMAQSGAAGIGGPGGSSNTAGNNGGAGGLYGGGPGGGGGGGWQGNQIGGIGPDGQQGCIVITYTPFVATPPTVTAVAPNSGSASGGQTITVTGTNFNVGVTAVKFGAVNAASFIVINNTTLTCVTPAQPAGTNTNVRVTTADGTSPIASGNAFSFVAPVGPAAGGFNMPMLGF